MGEEYFSQCISVRERFSPARAMRAQKILAKMVSLEDRIKTVDKVVGIDVSYKRVKYGELGIGVAVELDYPSLNVRKCNAYIGPVCIPYIPGLLAFREMSVLGPLLARVLSGDGREVLVVDGHGISHPRGLGIASHLGVVFKTPSIGVAKKKLYGNVVEKGGRRYIVDNDRVIGVLVGRVYVSPGTMISVEKAAEMIQYSMKRGSRLPEPIRIADSVSRKLKSRELPFMGWVDCSADAGLTGLLDYI